AGSYPAVTIGPPRSTATALGYAVGEPSTLAAAAGLIVSQIGCGRLAGPKSLARKTDQLPRQAQRSRSSILRLWKRLCARSECINLVVKHMAVGHQCSTLGEILCINVEFIGYILVKRG